MSVSVNNPDAQAFTIPLVNVPQEFQIPLANVIYNITNKWNDIGQYWCLDIADSNNNAIVSNVPLITGADCLAGLDYLGIEGSIYVLTSGSSPDDVPTLQTLGVSSNVYFVTTVASNG